MNRRERLAFNAWLRGYEKRRRRMTAKFKVDVARVMEGVLAPLKEGGSETVATFRYIAISALVTAIRDTPEEKYFRAALACRIRDAGKEIELTADEIKRLRAIIGDCYPQPEVVKAAWDHIDAAESVAPPKKVKK